jgi:hypothetical protein
LCVQISTVAQEQTTQPVKQLKSDKRSMIDQLANRNMPPKLFEVDGRPTPLFPANFDWSEQDRVKTALGKLHKERTAESWEQLLRNAEDNRYSMTVGADGEWASNRTVGDICAHLAYSRLIGVFEQHLVETNDPVKPGQIHLPIGITPTTVARWRQARKAKSLFELQIEVCERALKAMPTATAATVQQRTQMSNMIRAQIQKLRKERRAIILESNVLGLDTYNSELAKAMAERIGIGERDRSN